MSSWEESGKSDEWYTPKYIFDAMETTFDMDVAAPLNRSFCCVPAESFITEKSLTSDWSGFVWCNPPFGKRNGIAPWLDKMHSHGNGVALTPDRTSAPWWQVAFKKSGCALLVAGKIKFIKPDGTIGKQPGTGTTLFGYGSKSKEALQKAEENGLGVLCQIITGRKFL